MKKIHLSFDNIQQIIAEYKSGQSLKTIGNKLGYSGEYIRCTLKNNNIELRKYHQINRKHILNETLFDCIDTEEKSYFLGLLFADGNVNNKSNAIRLKLHQKDVDILKKLSNIVYDKEHLYKSENNYVLKFSSQNIKNKLIELGCIPNKSLKLKFPKIEKHLLNHFIRGYFDGDGSIFSYKKDFCVNMVSTNDFCQSVKNIIFNELNILGRINKDATMLKRGNDITSILKYGGNRRILKLMNWMYNDATLYLQRKYNKYLELKIQSEKIDNRKAA